jgi:hypothetical protein
MKHATSVFLIVFVLLIFAGGAFAEEMSGEVAAVDYAKGKLLLKSGSAAVGFDCETNSLVQDVKVGDKVTVQYNEEGGKKITTKVSPLKKRASVGC